MKINKQTNFLIVGLGLIGGSYAIGLKKQGYLVQAIDNNEETIKYALKHNIIDHGSCESDAFIEESNIIISGLYPQALIDWATENSLKFKEGTIITDVSGVKSNVVDKIQAVIPCSVEFIGSHPMAGKETSGVMNADENIFKGANFIITPTKYNTDEAIETLTRFAKIFGFGNISVLTPQQHDEMIGFVSQLTHVIAVSLMNTNDNTHLKEYTGDSFRDLTRIAKINENLWTELFFLNKDILIKEIESFDSELNNLKHKLINDDHEGLKQLFIQSTKRRKYFDK
ncbi:MAG: prephenate dehydrogenase [Erysipelotrichaceae bacterium]